MLVFWYLGYRIFMINTFENLESQGRFEGNKLLNKQNEEEKIDDLLLTSRYSSCIKLFEIALIICS